MLSWWRWSRVNWRHTGRLGGQGTGWQAGREIDRDGRRASLLVPWQTVHESEHVERLILVKTLPLQLAMVAKPLVDTLPHPAEDAEVTTLVDTQGGV